MNRTVRIAFTVFVIVSLAGYVQWGVSQARNDGPCRSQSLTDNEQKLLDRYLILREKNGRLILSQKLGDSCEIRRAAASWIFDTIAGQSSVDDGAYETSHRETLNRIILQVWPAIANSPAVPDDGALADGKWNILSASIISDDTVGTIVSQEVLKGGLWTAEARLMFTRNLRATPRLIQLVIANKKSDIVSKLYALALETRTNRTLHGVSISSIIDDVKLTNTEAHVVENLRKRINAHEPVEWLDVEDLATDEL